MLDMHSCVRKAYLKGFVLFFLPREDFFNLFVLSCSFSDVSIQLQMRVPGRAPDHGGCVAAWICELALSVPRPCEVREGRIFKGTFPP